MRCSLRILLCFLFLSSLVLAEPSVRVLDSRYHLDEIAAAPQIVTPVAIALDARGRLLVIENHTHQRPSDYAGPPHDLIKAIDLNADEGTAGRITEFYAGTRDTMSLLGVADGSVIVATRRDIFRLYDRNQDGVADERQMLVQMKTSGNYPHNGLAGLTLAPDGSLCFGMGENLGAPYELVGSDQTVLRGEAEGGNVYRCQLDGTGLQHVATGFWNPFGNCFDPHGRWFCVDNDPDASPPCRLLRVVPTGDYGFQFRYGRAGRHPLQSWDGELPGTLPMAAGTGEAPSEVVAHDGRLWVTSWGDHRIETYRIHVEGARVIGQQQIVVQGGTDFRPVGLAVADDGTIYFSDWVDRSYPVHGKGRIWRLRPRPEADVEAATFPPLSAQEQAAQRLEQQPDVQAQLQALSDTDLFIRQAAVSGLTRTRPWDDVSWDELADPLQRIGILQAMRWCQEPRLQQLLPDALQDANDQVQLLALRYIAELDLRQYREPILEQIPQLSDPQLLRTYLATVVWLDRDRATQVRSGSDGLQKIQQRLVQMVTDLQLAPALRATALQLLPVDHPQLTVDYLLSLAHSDKPQVAAEAIQILAQQNTPPATQALAQLAQSPELPATLRADAVAGLAVDASRYRDLLQKLAADAHQVIRTEAERNLRHVSLARHAPLRPSAEELDQWARRLDGGDVDAGRRVFFRAVGGRCWSCHRYGERGHHIGPDLTTIHRRATPQWLVQSILDPGSEVAPRFSVVTWITQDGRTISGMPLTGPAETGTETLLQSDGTQVTIPSRAIEERLPSDGSVMPSGMHQVLSMDELRDLLAFLQHDPSAGKAHSSAEADTAD